MPNAKRPSRRDVLKAAGAAGAVAAAIPTAGPAIQTVKAANDQIQFGMIGTGSRGSYLLGKHLKFIDAGRCVALCDIEQAALDRGASLVPGAKPKLFKDYRELLALKEVDAVFITTPLFEHFRMTKDALAAG